MTDLCHNCGDCHLGSHPTPCLQALNECIICKNFGHTFNFCPLSVMCIDKNYQYWMLCHNCDRWHLPRPCESDLVHCQNCGHIGHLPTFCPLLPDARLRPLGDSTAIESQRSRRTARDEHTANPSKTQLVLAVEQIHPDLLLQTQTQAISRMSQSLASIKQPGLQPQRDLSSLTLYQSMPISSLSAARHDDPNYLSKATLHSRHGFPLDNAQQQQHYLPVVPQKFPTPAPSSASKAVMVAAGEDPFVDGYQENQMQMAHDPNATESRDEASGDLESPETGKISKPSQKTRTQVTPCAACKNAKKGCKHMSDDATSGNWAAPEDREPDTAQPKIKRLKLNAGNRAPRPNIKQNEHTIAKPRQKSVDHVAIGQETDNQGPPYDHQGSLPDVNRNGHDIFATQLRTAVHNTPTPAAAQIHTLPSLGEMIGCNLASEYIAGNYLPYSDPTKSVTDGNNALQQMSSAVFNGPHTIEDPAFMSAQAESRRRSDVFSFGDNFKAESFRERYENVSVLPTTESPSGQIQHELPSPLGMHNTSVTPDETAPATETESAVKPKKSAPKKKGGGRKQKK